MSRSRHGCKGFAALGAVLLLMGPVRSAEPTVTLRLGPADAHSVPTRLGHVHTGGGNIDVRQPSPDTVIITLTGVAVAGGCPLCESLARFEAQLCQEFTVVFEKPEVQAAQLVLQGRVLGLLRNPCKGNAAVEQACAVVSAGDGDEVEIAAIRVDPCAAASKENRSIYARQGPVCAPVMAGCYRLRQTFALYAGQPKCGVPGQSATAEFAPSPALDPTWIPYKDPFHGVAKKEFGFQVILKVGPIEAPRASPGS